MITAYRAWRYRKISGRGCLVALRSDWVWEPERPAVCVSTYHSFYVEREDRPHRAPAHGCKCGYYSALQPITAYREAFSRPFTHQGPELIAYVLKVQVYGSSEPHEDGYRSEFIEPVAVLPGDPPPLFVTGSGSSPPVPVDLQGHVPSYMKNYRRERIEEISEVFAIPQVDHAGGVLSEHR